jgi:hypothetical protein
MKHRWLRPVEARTHDNLFWSMSLKTQSALTSTLFVKFLRKTFLNGKGGCSAVSLSKGIEQLQQSQAQQTKEKETETKKTW